MTDQPEAHVCKPGASLYYCPTSGRTESTCHGGHDVCCDRPDLHQLACGLCGGTGADPDDPETRGPCPECIQKGLPPRLDVRPLTVLDIPAGQPALEWIRASITAREQKADEAHEAGNFRTANEHNAIATGLRIAEAHVQLGHDAEVAMLRQRLALAATGLGGDKISLRKADVDLATAVRSRDGWRRDYAELADTYKRAYARADRDGAAIDRIRKLHRPVEHHGRIICAECSAYCGESTDNPPAPTPCPTIAALEPPKETPDA